MPPSTVIPVISYHNVSEACDWLCKAFGFTIRIQIGNHRVQLHVEDASIVITELNSQSSISSSVIHSVMIRVENIDNHFQTVKDFGAEIISPPTDQIYGERQYTVKDLEGHHWTFSQSIADVDPTTWGGTPVNI